MKIKTMKFKGIAYAYPSSVHAATFGHPEGTWYIRLWEFVTGPGQEINHCASTKEGIIDIARGYNAAWHPYWSGV